MALDYQFLSFPKGQVSSYGLTPHLWDIISDVQRSSPLPPSILKSQQHITEGALFKSGPRAAVQNEGKVECADAVFALSSMERIPVNMIYFSSLHFSKGAILVQESSNLLIIHTSHLSHETYTQHNYVFACFCFFE